MAGWQRRAWVQVEHEVRILLVQELYMCEPVEGSASISGTVAFVQIRSAERSDQQRSAAPQPVRHHRPGQALARETLRG